MALSDFQDDYTTRQSGLQTWLNGVGNATPAVPAYIGQGQTPAAGAQPVAAPALTALQQLAAANIDQNQQNQSPDNAAVAAQNTAAANAGFNTSEVNPQDTGIPNPALSQPYGGQEFVNGSGIKPMNSSAPDLSSVEPNQKAAALAQESFSPGSQNAIQPPAGATTSSQDNTPFRHTALGAFLAGVVPGLSSTFRAQQAQTMSDYWNSVKDEDPVTQLTGAMKVDPNNAARYSSELSQYVQSNNSPMAKTQAEEAQMNLGMEKFKARALMKGMQEAQNYADSIGQPPAAATAPPMAPTDRASMLGPPAEWQNQNSVAAQTAKAKNAGFDTSEVNPGATQGSALQAFDKYPAQTEKESGGNPNAVSPKGALGAKQIMPSTGADPGYGVKPWDGSDADNIRFGNDYYDAMLKNYKGNVPVALAAYNMGPGKTDKWLKAGADPAQLPSETMDYVTKLAPKMQAEAEGGGGQPTAPAQPLTALQEHQKMMAHLAASGAIPASEFYKSIDPLENQPTYKMNGDVLYQQRPGEAPTPYVVPPAQGVNGQPAAPGPSAGANPTPKFGFSLPPMNTAQVKDQQQNDKTAQLAYQNNRPIIQNALRILDALEPNLTAITTGKGRSEAQAINSVVNSFVPHVDPNSKLAMVLPTKGGDLEKQAIASANIDKGTNDLALELSKFQPAPGSRGGNKLQLQTILNSKPGMGYPLQTNQNITAGLRAKLVSADISGDIDQQYRSASPMGITDDNTRQLDDALKTLYPIEENKDGGVQFNAQNANTIRRLIPDAIANPQKYLDKAKAVGYGAVPYDPTKAAEGATPAQKATAMNFDAQGNLIQ